MKSIDVDSANAVYKSAGGMLLSKDGSTLAVCPGSKKDAVIPEGVTSIAPYAFGRCKNMTSVTVPASVISIGENAFYGCGSLKTVNYTKWRTDWEKIVIADDNDALNNAEINSKTERTRAIVIFIVIGAALAVAIVILSVLKKKKKKTPELPDTAVKKQP